MHQLDDPNYLRNSQYRDSDHLTRRVSLHTRFSTNPQGWFAWLASQLDYPPQSRLLEVGCGPGLLWLSQPACLPPSAVLSDFSSGMTAEARQSLQSSRGDIHFAVLDVTSLPFPAHSFDVVIANHMLYHVPDRPRAITALRRVLRPGGKLFAATNGQRHLTEIYSWVARAADLSTSEITHLWDSVTLSFNLENGADQLRGYFEHVEMVRYPDSLAVTEIAPLLDYAGTMMGDMPAILRSSSVRDRLTALWQQELERAGVIHISKDAGLFIAS